jgi:hypothetical protein
MANSEDTRDQISSHPAVFFSHNKPTNSTFSHNKPAKRTGWHEGGIPDKLTDMIKLALAIRQP